MKIAKPTLPSLNGLKIGDILRPADPKGQAGQEKRVRRSIFPTLRRAASAIPFSEDVLASYYCALDPTTPARSRGLLLAALAYFVMPVDFFPDLLPLIGFTDDAAVLLAAFAAVRTNIKPQHYLKARRTLNKGDDAPAERTP